MKNITKTFISTTAICKVYSMVTENIETVQFNFFSYIKDEKVIIKEVEKSGEYKFLKLVSKDSIEVIRSMDEEKFIYLAHPLEENEKRIGMVTRTIKNNSYMWKYYDVHSDELDICSCEYHTSKEFNKAYPDRIACKLMETISTEILYGISELDFFTNSETITR